MDEPTQETNPLEFWVAYRKGADDKFYYLGNGKGSIRLFKTEQGLNTFLDSAVSVEMRNEIVTHTVQGKIALAESLLPQGALVPISTLAPSSLPGAKELLRSYLQRRRN